MHQRLHAVADAFFAHADTAALRAASTVAAVELPSDLEVRSFALPEVNEPTVAALRNIAQFHRAHERYHSVQLRSCKQQWPTI